MKRQIARILGLMLAVVLFCGLTPTALAHNASAVSLGGTYVQFSYSDGTLIKGAKIVVQDSNGETLGAGKTDSNGIYNYADYEGSAFKIIMNDGEGHMVEYTVPEQTPPITDQTQVEDDAPPAAGEPNQNTPAEDAAPPAAPANGGMSMGTIIAIVVVVVAAVVIAIFFSKRTKQK